MAEDGEAKVEWLSTFLALPQGIPAHDAPGTANGHVAIPALLTALDVSGCAVTIDAMGCQTDIAQQIIDQEGDDLLALKGNYPLLYEDTQLLFDHLADCGVTVNEQNYHRQVDKGHGRIEIRQAWVVSDATILKHLRARDKWLQLAALVKLQAERLTSAGRQTHTRYDLASCHVTPIQAITSTRRH